MPPRDGVHSRGGTRSAVVDDDELEGNVRVRRGNAVQAFLKQIDPLPRDDKDRDDGSAMETRMRHVVRPPSVCDNSVKEALAIRARSESYNVD